MAEPTPTTYIHPHPAAAGDGAYVAEFYTPEPQEGTPADAPPPGEWVKVTERSTGNIIVEAPADSQWIRGEDGKPITYSDRFRGPKEAEPAATPEAAEAGEPVDLNAKTVAELKAALDAAGVSYSASASKATLIQLCEDNDVTVE